MIRTLGEHLGSLVVTVDVDGVRLDVRGTVVEARGRCVDLTPKEIQLLRALAVRPGAVVSKSALLQQVWGGTTDDPHLVEVTVARLRRRLDDGGPGRRHDRPPGLPPDVAGAGGGLLGLTGDAPTPPTGASSVSRCGPCWRTG